MPRLIPFTEPDEMKSAGLPFKTTDSARWGYRTRHETGTADAFIKIGKRIYVDPDRYHKLVRQSGRG